MIPNKGNDMHIHEILESVMVERVYLISEHPHVYGNKGISTINIKRIHVCHQGESKINISSKQYGREYHKCRAPTKALINFA